MDVLKLTTRGKYGLMAMYELGANPDVLISAASIAKRQDISETYLEQLLSALRKAKLIASIRGAQGGYKLSKPAGEIGIGDILRALENTTQVTECIGEEHCGSTCNCVSRPVYAKIQEGIDAALSSMTLLDMVNQQKMEGSL